MKISSPRGALLLVPFVVGGVLAGGLGGCSSGQSLGEAPTQALQNRQQTFNNMADAAAERRAIRSENADARNQATFDAMMQ